MTTSSLMPRDARYHEARVLLLIDAACRAPQAKGALTGLTKLAKMDFLIRYPALAPTVLGHEAAEDRRLRISPEHDDNPTRGDDPMIRYKYGPWDERYYEVLGRLVGRGLATCTRTRNSVRFRVTDDGRATSQILASRSEWRETADRCAAIADLTSTLTGNQLKNLIYERLPELMDRPYREVIA